MDKCNKCKFFFIFNIICNNNIIFILFIVNKESNELFGNAHEEYYPRNFNNFGDEKCKFNFLIFYFV